jgi:hypothetical protein
LLVYYGKIPNYFLGDELENQIDNLIYELYDLTSEEIITIEKHD